MEVVVRLTNKQCEEFRSRRCNFNDMIRHVWHEAQKAEREACAALCSETAAGRDADAIEAAILARGEK